MSKAPDIVIPPRFAPLYNPVPEYHSYLYWGGRAGGKSYEVALALLMRGALIPGFRCACVREYQRSLKESVFSLMRDICCLYHIAGYTFKDSELKIVHQNGSYFTFHGLKDHNADSIKGLAEYNAAWVEEGQSLSKRSVDILDPTIRGKNPFIVITMNRYSMMDPAWTYYTGPRSPKRYVNRVLYTHNAHCPQSIIDTAEACRVTDTEEYSYIWLGEPQNQTASAICSAQSISEAMNGSRLHADGPIRWGLDVARMGDDSSVLSKARGNRLLIQYERKKSPLDQTVDWVEQHVTKGERIKVDDTGLGGGVTDYLKRHGHNVVPVVFGAAASDRQHYHLVADEIWFQFQDMQDEVILPQDNRLFEELTFRAYGTDKYGKRRVQSKEEFKKIIHRSPDRADSALLAFYEPEVKTYRAWVL